LLLKQNCILQANDLKVGNQKAQVLNQLHHTLYGVTSPASTELAASSTLSIFGNR